MHLGDIANEAALDQGKPLDGVRVLALEQMQSLPYATQLLGRLGAEVVKVEHPTTGDQGRGALPAMQDPNGRCIGATFLRNNLSKRSVGIDLKSRPGRDLVLRLAPSFDVVAENAKPGSMARLGSRYDGRRRRPPRRHLPLDLRVRQPADLARRGRPTTPGRRSPPIAEAMSGIYELKRDGDQPPVVAPVGALGDIGTALFAVIGVLAALRQRDRTGEGQHVDVAMLDSVVAITDIVTNFWSMGLRGGELGPLIMHGFKAADGWFVVQVGREHQFAALVEAIGHPEWADRHPLRHAPGLDRPSRQCPAAGDRGVGVDAHEGRRSRRARTGRHRCRTVLHRRGGRRATRTWTQRHMLVACPASTASTSPSSCPATR